MPEANEVGNTQELEPAETVTVARVREHYAAHRQAADRAPDGVDIDAADLTLVTAPVTVPEPLETVQRLSRRLGADRDRVGTPVGDRASELEEGIPEAIEAGPRRYR